MGNTVGTMGGVDALISSEIMGANDFIMLRRTVRGDEDERRKLQEYVEELEEQENLKPDERLKLAVCYWILARHDQALNLLSRRNDHISKYIKACVYANKGENEKAYELFMETKGNLNSGTRPEVDMIELLQKFGRIDEATEMAKEMLEKAPDDPDALYHYALIVEEGGNIPGAVEIYEKIVNELDPNHPGACFRLAYYSDLHGDDEQAIELYSRISGNGSLYVSAMINLGLLFEDMEEYNKAVACYRDALEVDPTNERARLYEKNAAQSLDMYYDETERKESERMEAVLRTPISDFELSVRSRNCLLKMSIKSLGDLVKKSEQELLAYKNFGETSLHEIRDMLSSKSLRLGMATDQDAIQRRRDRLRLSGSDEATLSKPISQLDLSVRSRKCMQRLGIETLGDLIEKTDAELLSIKNFGQTSLEEVKRKLAENSLSLHPMHTG